MLLKDMIAMQDKMIDMKEERIETLGVDASRRDKQIQDQDHELHQREKMLTAKE